MVAARNRVLEMGGPTKANVFTKIQLALFGEYDWNGVPTMPAEIMLLPPPFFLFNIYEVSYWSRCVIVPLLIIMDRKPIKWLPSQSLDELWPVPRATNEPALPASAGAVLLARSVLEERLHRRRRRAQDLGALLAAAAAQAGDRRGPAVAGGAAGGARGLGGIYPAMANSCWPCACSAIPRTTR